MKCSMKPEISRNETKGRSKSEKTTFQTNPQPPEEGEEHDVTTYQTREGILPVDRKIHISMRK